MTSRFAPKTSRTAFVMVIASFLLMGVGCGPKSGKKTSRTSTPVSESIAPDGQEQQFIDDERQLDQPQQQVQQQQPHEDFDQDLGGEAPPRLHNDENGSAETVPVQTSKPYSRDGYRADEDYGKEYEVVHKGDIYDNQQPKQASGDRFGELGAVMFDDPMWYPGLPDYPAGTSQSKLTPIFTGGKSEGGYKFTDGKSDALMAYAVKEANRIGTKGSSDLYHEGIQEESRKLAERIMDVKLTVDAYSKASVRLEIQFADGDVKNPVNSLFHGQLDARRMSKLTQQNIKGDKDLTFKAQIVCMDQDGGCQNAVIELIQMKDGKVCRMAYIVHRSGDAHITMSESDRLHWSANPNEYYQYMAQYIGNTAYNACLINKNRKDIPNRATQHFLAYCGDSTHRKLPAAKSIGMRTWAAAYGASGFRILLNDEPHWTGYDDNAQTVISGPLVHADVKNPIYSKKLGVGGKMRAYIRSAHLVNNDAGGNLNFVLRLCGEGETEMRLSVTSLIRNTIYPKDLRPEETFPEDERG